MYACGCCPFVCLIATPSNLEFSFPLSIWCRGEDGYFRIAQEGGGRWGLFGMLAEGVIPLEAFNSTFATTSGTVSPGASWMWLAAAGIVAALVFNG